MATAEMQYYVDDLGRVWRGPRDGVNGAYFESFQGVVNGEEIWASEKTQPGLEPIDHQHAARVMRWFANGELDGPLRRGA